MEASLSTEAIASEEVGAEEHDAKVLSSGRDLGLFYVFLGITI